MEDLKSLYHAFKTEGAVLTIAELVELALGVMLPAARCIVLGWIEMSRGNEGRALHFMQRAETRSANDKERAYVFHCYAMLLLKIGDGLEAVQKEKACLDLCEREGDVWLKGESMSHLGFLYRMLGYEDLGEAYAHEAAGIISD